MKLLKIETFTGVGNPPTHVFKCPGCGYAHGLWIDRISPKGTQHTLRGTLDNPTILPSIEIKIGDKIMCHSLIANGNIKFYENSKHKLVNQEVELPNIN